jgi:hypothetical protein
MRAMGFSCGAEKGKGRVVNSLDILQKHRKIKKNCSFGY